MKEKMALVENVVGSDLFLGIPLSAQALYFHMLVRTDDDGLANNPSAIQKMTNTPKNDMQILAENGFIVLCQYGMQIITDLNEIITWREINGGKKNVFKGNN